MHPIINRLKMNVYTWQSQNLDPAKIRVMVKEGLQDEILTALYRSQFGPKLVFIGGTFLRKLHHLPRFSEDLDFVFQEPITLTVLGDEVVKYFHNLNFHQVTYSIQANTLLHRLTFKFNVLHDLGLSPLQSENLHVKVESTLKHFDYPTETKIQSLSHQPIIITTYDLPTSMASKILACLNRVYKKGDTNISVKGRDYFDLIWYLEQKIKPNSQVWLDFDTTLSQTKVLELLDEKVIQIKVAHLWADLATYIEDVNYAKYWCDHFQNHYSSVSQYLRS